MVVVRVGKPMTDDVDLTLQIGLGKKIKLNLNNDREKFSETDKI